MERLFQARVLDQVQRDMRHLQEFSRMQRLGLLFAEVWAAVLRLPLQRWV